MDAANVGVWFVLFIAGLAIGSFLNVCIYRIPRNKSLVLPRSSCPGCDTPIKWHDNIPILSFLLLLGRCRHCKAKISAQYPLVELLTGYVFVHLYFVFVQCRHESLWIYFVYLVLCCALIISTFVDLEFLVIPDEVTFVCIPLALLFSAAFPELHDAPHTLRHFSMTGITRIDALIASILGMLVGGGMIFLCGVLGKLVFRKDAMGVGDVKLMGMVGGVVGWKLAATIFFVAPFFGLFMAIPTLLLKKKHLIPYGPFLSLATLVCLFMQDYFIELVNVYVKLFNIVCTGSYS